MFTNLELESLNEDCSKASLVIDEIVGDHIEKNLTKRFCDASEIDENLLNFNSTSNTISISFKRKELNFETPKSILRLEWYLVGCGQEFLYKSTGVIETPNYPKLHSYELDCVWHIYTNPSNRIILVIHDFDISTGGKCTFGFVKVLGGPTIDSPELSKICEKPSNNVQVTSPGSSMTIVLKNELGIRGKGFSAQYFVDRNRNCGGTYTTIEGE